MPAALFLLGLLFGSFLNVCIHRLPRGLSIVTPRSACPHCAHPIRAYDNIPLLSWLLLRGRCRDCRAPISLRYPAVELATALLFLAAALHFPSALEIAKYCCLSALLIVLFFTDLEHQLLPDAVTVPGATLGLLFSLFLYVPGVPGFLLLPHSPLQIRLLSLFHSALGAATGAAFLFLLAELYLRARGQHGMGLGDVKLMALIGAFLGFRLALLTVFAAALAGSLLGLSALAPLFRKRLHRYRRSSIHGEPSTPCHPERAQRVEGLLFSHMQHELSSPEPPPNPDPRVPHPSRPSTKGATPRLRAWSSARLMLRHFPLPFGTLLSAAALLASFYGNRLLHWYWNLF